MTRTEQKVRTALPSESIYLQRWTPAGDNPSQTILITHGVAEHSDCYQKMAESLVEQNIQVFAWDLPGHGRSYGQRGYISQFSEFTDQMNLVIEHVQGLISKESPFFLFGHSLGGLITLKYALAYFKTKSLPLCLSSPALGVTVKVPFLKDQAAKVLMKLAPKVTIPHQIIYEDLSRDSEFVKSYYKDPLRHCKFSAPLYFGILEAMADVRERAHQIKAPLFIQAAGVDRIVSTLAIQELFPHFTSPQKTLKIYPESYHEIFNDTNRQEVIDDFVNYLRQFKI